MTATVYLRTLKNSTTTVKYRHDVLLYIHQPNGHVRKHLVLENIPEKQAEISIRAIRRALEAMEYEVL